MKDIYYNCDTTVTKEFLILLKILHFEYERLSVIWIQSDGKYVEYMRTLPCSRVEPVSLLQFPRIQSCRRNYSNCNNQYDILFSGMWTKAENVIMETVYRNRLYELLSGKPNPKRTTTSSNVGCSNKQLLRTFMFNI